MLWNENEYCKNRGNENLKGTIPSGDYDRSERIFNYLGSMITNDASYTDEIKSRIGIAKAAFKRKKTFYKQTGLELKE
jgi:predicted RNA-binding protein (virulence factor B family)